MRAMWIVGAVAWLLGTATVPSSADILKVKYDGFTVWVDCDRGGPVLFHYVARSDTGSFPRHGSYDIDDNVGAECQFKST